MTQSETTIMIIGLLIAVPLFILALRRDEALKRDIEKGLVPPPPTSSKKTVQQQRITGSTGTSSKSLLCAQARRVRIVDYGSHSSSWHNAETIRVYSDSEARQASRGGTRVENVRVVEHNMDPGYHSADPVRIVKDPGGSMMRDEWHRATRVRILDC